MVLALLSDTAVRTESEREVIVKGPGDHAHSREFSEQAYQLAAEPKQLVTIPGAGHVDLYDRTDVIPFDTLSTFFQTNLDSGR
jgi:fermentation-respiration switch protein FrsA (DUF1100 family)